MKENCIKDVAVLIPSLDPDDQMVCYVKGLKEHGVENSGGDTRFTQFWRR